VSAKGFLTKCGTSWRFLLFESRENGDWTYVRNGLGAKVQYVNIYSKLNLSSSLTSDENFLIKPSGLLTLIFNSFFRIFIYLCIHSLLNFNIYVLHYCLWKCIRRTKKYTNLLTSLWKGSFSMPLRTRQTDYNNSSLSAPNTDRQLSSIFQVGSPAWAKHVFLGFI
jgi:hypothetical protein